MEQFLLEKHLENPSRKVVTRDGRAVRIICWDAKSSKPIVALVSTRSISQRQFDELTINYFNDGTYYGGAKEESLDLFFADEEKVNSIIDELKSYLEKTPKEQVEKDWKEIQDWYTQHFTNEKHNEEDELTEFEKELEKFRTHILATSGEKYDENGEGVVKKVSRELLDSARKEILKDLPKWKDVSGKNGAGTKDYEIVGYYLVKGNYAIYLEDLDKLPKEE